MKQYQFLVLIGILFYIMSGQYKDIPLLRLLLSTVGILLSIASFFYMKE